ncbi:MAG: PKD domain-containing protein [Roseiflexaceae bacterium]
MRKLIICLILGAAALLSACGAGQVQDTSRQVGTAVSGSDAATAVSLGSTAVAAPEAGTAEALVRTAVAAPEAGTAEALVGTAVAAPEAGTAEAVVSGAVQAAADDVTIQQGQALVLDATKSVGDIKDYKWTITKAPTGAETVVGQVIQESSSGNISLNPTDYAKYFPMAGDYTVRLTVTDAQGASSNDDFTITMP